MSSATPDGRDLTRTTSRTPSTSSKARSNTGTGTGSGVGSSFRARFRRSSTTSKAKHASSRSDLSAAAAMDGEGESDGKAGTGNGNGTWPGKEKERELPPLPRRDGIVSRPSEESVQHADGNAWGSSRLMGKGAERDLSSEKEERSTLDAAKAALGMQTSAEPTPHSSSTTSSGEKAAPSSPASGETHPLADQVSLIIYFMAGTVLAALVLAKIHWMLSIVVAGAATHVLWKKLGCAIKDEEWERQMDRIAAANEDGRTESVEWVNAALGTAWPLINSDYFVPFIDLLEDSLMAQVPGIVHSVRVEDLDQGAIPLRLKTFKILPPSETDFLANSEAEKQKGGKQETPAAAATALTMEESQENDVADEDEEEGPGVDTGDYVNLEVTFSYRRNPKRARKQKISHAKANRSDAPKETEKGTLEIGETMVESTSNPAMDAAALTADLPVEQIHMLLYLSVGLQKIAGIDLPVWIEVVGIEGKMRLRMQLVPAAPFVKHVAFTFVGAPRVEISAKPLGKRMILDVMDLPFLSSYVLRSIDEVVKDFIAPKSYTIDVGHLLGGNLGPEEAYSIGILVVVIHQATDLPAADTNGYSDPFVICSFARSGKPIFTTRVLVRTKNPIWQETAFLMVSPDEVRDHERLRLTVFDADRFSADDPLGKVEVSVDRLIRRSRNEHMTQKSRNLFESRTDDLQPMRRSGKTQGKLKYSVGFFGIARSSVREQPAKRAALLKEAARQDRERLSELNATDHSAHAAGATHSTDFANKETSDRITPDAPDDGVPDLTTPFDRFVRSLGLPLDDEVMNRRKQRDIRVAKLLNMLEGSHNASEEAPNPELPTGLLVFHIHSIENLEVQNTQKSFNNSKRLGTKPRYTQSDDPGIEGTGAGKLPSSYVQVMLNDEAIYRTRTKTLNPRPFINGGSERFVGDWRTARIDFVVRDARMREGDPILGVVSLKVAEVLKKASRSTGWYPLTGGLGYGKIGISLLFKSVELSVPAPLRGWNIGVLEMGSMRALGLPQQYFAKRHCHVFFETVGGSSLTESAEPVDDYESGEGESAKVDYQWNLKDPVRVPVRQRYPAFLYIHLRSESRIPGRHHTHAHGVIPLNRIPDDHETFKRVPIFETSDWHRFEQDMLHQMADDDELASPTSGGEAEDLPILEKLCRQDRLTLSKDVLSDGHIKRIGWLEINLIFHSGIAPEHRSLVAGDHEMRFAFEAYQAMTDAGERPKPKTISTARRRKLSEASHHQRPASIDLQKNRMSAPPQSRKSLQVDTAVGAGTSGDAQPVSPQRRRRTLSAADTPTDRNADGDAEKTPTAADRQGPWSPQSPQSPWRPHTPNMQDGIDLDELYEPSLIDDEDRPDAYGDEYEGEDGEGVEEEDDPDEVTPEGRRARRRSLHRQHRGAAQIKTFRTMEWLKTNASDGVGRFKNQFGKQKKYIPKVENEGISHF